MCSLVPVILGDVMRYERMLVSGSGNGRDQGKTILQLVGDRKNAHGLELDIAVMTRSGALEHLGRWVKRILAGREPTPLLAIRPGRRLLNASHLHRIIEEPTVSGASRAGTWLNYGRRTGTIERR